MTPIQRPTHTDIISQKWQGVLIRLVFTLGLLVLALALASRFG